MDSLTERIFVYRKMEVIGKRVCKKIVIKGQVNILQDEKLQKN